MSLESFKEVMSRFAFGNSRQEAILNSTCVKCGTFVDVNSFKDEISRKEYNISQLCECCQNDLFNIKEINN